MSGRCVYRVEVGITIGFVFIFFLMMRRPPRSTRTDTTLSRHDALPICYSTSQLAFVAAVSLILYATFALVQTRSEEHTSELQSLMRISYAVFCLKKKNKNNTTPHPHPPKHPHTKLHTYHITLTTQSQPPHPRTPQRHPATPTNNT